MIKIQLKRQAIIASTRIAGLLYTNKVMYKFWIVVLIYKSCCLFQCCLNSLHLHWWWLHEGGWGVRGLQFPSTHPLQVPTLGCNAQHDNKHHFNKHFAVMNIPLWLPSATIQMCFCVRYNKKPLYRTLLWIQWYSLRHGGRRQSIKALGIQLLKSQTKQPSAPTAFYHQ